MSEPSQAYRLARPFPPETIKKNPSGGGSYVKHSLYVEKLIAVCGGYDFEIVEVIRGTVQGKAPNPNGKSDRAKAGTPDLVDAVVGCLSRLTVEVDGITRTIVEVGDCEEPHNWNHDGARLKDAASDSLKRCSMRLGVAIHLYSQELFRLDRALAPKDDPSPAAE
jgi:hypothetical protein